LGDFHADGTVNAGDLNKIGQNWLTAIPLAASPESVPEPAAISLLYVGGFLVALMRLQRNEGCGAPTLNLPGLFRKF
jgi:hypothetical protein